VILSRKQLLLWDLQLLLLSVHVGRSSLICRLIIVVLRWSRTVGVGGGTPDL
jgi:hypothetical protein